MHQFHIKLGLENIEKLLAHLGNPEKKLKTIHIAGSNGKGSTSSFIASILMEAGFKVGLFTSPHFVKFNERVRINGQVIPDEYITKFIEEMDEYIRENEPTFFEITTAMAFNYFAENDLDYCVIETGLGGRLDATNVLEPIASAITSISLEHTNILGTDLAGIAREKGGIIKSGTKLFIGKMPEVAENELNKIASNKECSTWNIKNYITEVDENIILKFNNKNYHIYKTGLPGYHQKLNTALALKLIEETFGIIDEDIIYKGLMNVSKNSGIQGRYEIFNKEPQVIFDAAHNLEGVEWFVKQFEVEYRRYDKRILIIGAMKDKDIDQMLEKLAPYFDEIRFSAIEYERALTIEELISRSEKYKHKIFREDSPANYLNKFLQTKNNNCLVLLGSIYLLGKIKENIEKMA